MKTVSKVGALVIRRSPAGGRAQLLLFAHADHPDVPLQIPGGGIDPGEQPGDAVLRELREEAGLTGLPLLRFVGIAETPWHLDPTTLLRRHFYLFDGAGLPDHWLHHVTGAGEDLGLRFAYRWHDIAPGFTLVGDLGHFLTPDHLPELYPQSVPPV